MTPRASVEPDLSLYDAVRRRRDVRAEFTGEVIDDARLLRILDAAHRAPSVGNSQPWDFVVVRDPATLDLFATHVAEQRRAFADSLPVDRAAVFEPIRIEGIRESGTSVVVTYDPTRGGRQVLGRQTVDETGLMSVALAIENLWLAGVAEGAGVGWVSFYREEVLADLVGCVAPVRPMAWLCVGPVVALQETPDLVRLGWRAGRPLEDAVHFEHLGARAVSD